MRSTHLRNLRADAWFPETHQLSYLFYRTDDPDLSPKRARPQHGSGEPEAYRYLDLRSTPMAITRRAARFRRIARREPEGSLANADVYFDMGITAPRSGRSAARNPRLPARAQPASRLLGGAQQPGRVLHDQGSWMKRSRISHRQRLNPAKPACATI